MKKNKLEIIIAASVETVFEFTVNPANTSKWIEGIEKEETNEFPAKVGTVYKNLNKENIWTGYDVIALEKNKLFQLKQKNSSYSVRYDYEQVSGGETKLIYTEWVNEGELKSPFSQETLEKLKKVIEER